MKYQITIIKTIEVSEAETGFFDGDDAEHGYATAIASLAQNNLDKKLRDEFGFDSGSSMMCEQLPKKEEIQLSPTGTIDKVKAYRLKHKCSLREAIKAVNKEKK